MVPATIDNDTISKDRGLINQMHNAMKPEDSALLTRKIKLISNFKYLRDIIKPSPPRTAYAITDAVSAPIMPKWGTKITFRMMFNTVAMLINIMSIWVLPARKITYITIWYKHVNNPPIVANAITELPEMNSGVVNICNKGLANMARPTAQGMAIIIKYLNEYLK
jgi:hypothetical protein